MSASAPTQEILYKDLDEPGLNTLEGYEKKAIPLLVADKRMAASIDPATVVDAQFCKHVETAFPQFFSDLPPIPADRRL